MKMIKNKKQKGYTLIELLLVLGLSSLAFVSFVKWESKKVDLRKAEIAGTQFVKVGEALASYIVREQLNLVYNIPVNTSSEMPLSVLQGVSSGTFNGHKYLETNFNTEHAFGSSYTIKIKHNLGGIVEGVILSSAPVCEFGEVDCPSATNQIKYDWVGIALKQMGPYGGVVRVNGTSTDLLGVNASWKINSALYADSSGSSVINEAGQIGYRVSPLDTTIYDQQYLRLDASNTMLGNLNMGNYNIDNATNISYTGWLQGYGVLANTIRSAYIYNTGDIQTQNIYIDGIMKVGDAQMPTELGTVAVASGVISDAIEAGDVIVDKNLYARDIYLGNDINSDNRTRVNQTTANRNIPNAWLSDLLPKYSSRGVYAVLDGGTVQKPTCNGGGTPKIQVIPQFQQGQGKLLGENFLTHTLDITSFAAWLAAQPTDPTLTNAALADTFKSNVQWDLVTHVPNMVYAVDGATSWTINLKSYNYNGYVINNSSLAVTPPKADMTLSMPPGGGTSTALAHVYCDYNF